MAIKQYRQKGYTLMEMIIVVALITVLMPTIFSIIYVIVQQQLKIFQLIETKRQGDRIMTFMKEKIAREGVQIRDGSLAAPANLHCDSAANNNFTSASGADFVFMKGVTAGSPRFTFSVVGTNLFLNDTAPVLNTGLNDFRVRITNFQIQCFRRNNLTSPLVGFTYTVTFIDNTPGVQDTTLRYQTKIKIRY